MQALVRTRKEQNNAWWCQHVKCTCVLPAVQITLQKTVHGRHEQLAKELETLMALLPGEAKYLLV